MLFIWDIKWTIRFFILDFFFCKISTFQYQIRNQHKILNKIGIKNSTKNFLKFFLRGDPDKFCLINFVRVPPYKKFPKIFFCYFLYLLYSKFYADYESDIINLLFRSLNDKKTDFYLKNPLFTKKAILNITFFDF